MDSPALTDSAPAAAASLCDYVYLLPYRDTRTLTAGFAKGWRRHCFTSYMLPFRHCYDSFYSFIFPSFYTSYFMLFYFNYFINLVIVFTSQQTYSFRYTYLP